MPNKIKGVEIDPVREKLVDLLLQAHNKATDASAFDGVTYAQQLEAEADYLIANGVTVQKWISVKDRYPDKEGFYIGFFEARPGHWRVSTLHWNGTNWNNIGGYIPTSVKTTHWMPLPQPPKGDEPC